MLMNATIGIDQWHSISQHVNIRRIDEMQSGAENLVKDFYFEGLNVLRCYEGRYRFERKGYPVIYLESDEVFFIYPGHNVTIDALTSKNRLVYGIFTGQQVAEYFNAMGCFDGLRGKTSSRESSVRKIRELMNPELYRTAEGHDACMAYLSDYIVTLVNDVRTNGNPLVYDAVRQIRRNLSKGVVRLQELCDALGVCRSYLHRIFRNEGLGSVAEFIKTEQLHQALWMLRNTELSVAEIAKSTGFISVTHFSTFIRKRAGRAPRELR